jgi:hypothetical protein
MTSGGESERLFEAYSIPSPARPLFQTAFGNLNRRSPAAMDTRNLDRGPLLLICRQKTTWSQTPLPVPIARSMANRRP